MHAYTKTSIRNMVQHYIIYMNLTEVSCLITIRIPLSKKLYFTTLLFTRCSKVIVQLTIDGLCGSPHRSSPICFWEDSTFNGLSSQQNFHLLKTCNIHLKQLFHAMILNLLVCQQVIVTTGKIMETVVRLVVVESRFAQENAQKTAFI